MAITVRKRKKIQNIEFELLRELVEASDTLLTADNINQSIQQLIAGGLVTFSVAFVELLAAVRIMFYGTGADDATATVNLYGWMQQGPGSHIGTVSLVACGSVSQDSADTSPGFHGYSTRNSLQVVSGTDDSIRGAFAAGTDYRAIDTHTISSNPEASLAAVNFTDLPGWLELDFARTQYAYIAALFTLGTMTSIGAIYRPLALKGQKWPIDGLT